MQKFYFTFGSGQGKLAKRFVVIEANNSEEARTQMCEMFGKNWSFDYTEEEWTYRKGTKDWNRMVEYGAIPYNAEYDSITQAELFKLKQLDL